MLQIVFDTYDFRYRMLDGKKQIFDILRRKWIQITPEEWVRQNWIRYLVQTCAYPIALIGVEKKIMVGDLEKRFDLLVYNKQHEPWFLIECKAPEVALTTAVLDQLLRYHQRLPATYLMMTNGSSNFLWKKVEKRLDEQFSMPVWE